MDNKLSYTILGIYRMTFDTSLYIGHLFDVVKILLVLSEFTGLCKLSFAGVMDSHLSFFLIGGDAYNLNRIQPWDDHREPWMI